MKNNKIKKIYRQFTNKYKKKIHRGSDLNARKITINRPAISATVAFHRHLYLQSKERNHFILFFYFT